MASILSYSTKQSKTALLKCSILLHTLEEYYYTGTSGILRNQALEIHVDLKTKLCLFTREDGSSRILRSLFCIPFREVGPLLRLVVFLFERVHCLVLAGTRRRQGWCQQMRTPVTSCCHLNGAACVPSAAARSPGGGSGPGLEPGCLGFSPDGQACLGVLISTTGY